MKSCVCRAPVVSVYRNGEHRFVFYQCQDCGREWSESAAVEDLAEVVTANELISVHEALASDSLTFDDLKE